MCFFFTVQDRVPAFQKRILAAFVLQRDPRQMLTAAMRSRIAQVDVQPWTLVAAPIAIPIAAPAMRTSRKRQSPSRGHLFYRRRAKKTRGNEHVCDRLTP
jgi:hypothetical protein